MFGRLNGGKSFDKIFFLRTFWIKQKAKNKRVGDGAGGINTFTPLRYGFIYADQVLHMLIRFAFSNPFD